MLTVVSKLYTYDARWSKKKENAALGNVRQLWFVYEFNCDHNYPGPNYLITEAVTFFPS